MEAGEEGDREHGCRGDFSARARSAHHRSAQGRRSRSTSRGGAAGAGAAGGLGARPMPARAGGGRRGRLERVQSGCVVIDAEVVDEGKQ